MIGINGHEWADGKCIRCGVALERARTVLCSTPPSEPPTAQPADTVEGAARRLVLALRTRAVPGNATMELAELARMLGMEP
jgi:hypothetical protein